jgi:hypothetical protein
MISYVGSQPAEFLFGLHTYPFKKLTLIEKNLCSPITLELCLLRPKRRAIGPIAQAIWKAFEARSHRSHK